MSEFEVVHRPLCLIVHEKSISLSHTVIFHQYQIEVHTDMIGSADYRMVQDGVTYEKYRSFKNWEEFEKAMPGTAECIAHNLKVVNWREALIPRRKQ